MSILMIVLSGGPDPSIRPRTNEPSKESHELVLSGSQPDLGASQPGWKATQQDLRATQLDLRSRSLVFEPVWLNHGNKQMDA